MKHFLEFDEAPIQLPSPRGGIKRFHQFDSNSVDAVNASMASGRPLLVRGEPGVGKTQLAEAVAEKLKRAFLRHVVDSRAESRDLLYHFDAVMRLAEAQLCGAEGASSEEARSRLSLRNFIRPGPLWWAFNATEAQCHCQSIGCVDTPLAQYENERRSKNGWVVLIDEIDKGESDVPNGLLEALGAGQFQPLGFQERIEMAEPAPLVIITTNEERILPDAFVRRCLVLHIALPQERAALIQLLKQRGEAHFGADQSTEHQQLLRKAAELLADDRQAAMQQQLTPLPGQAEYLDLLRGVIRRADDAERRLELLQSVANYALRKHSEMQR